MFPHELSGGTKRRINLLMTFLNPSNIILLDEPFNQIDMINKEYFYDFIKTLNQEFNKIILINTHDINEAINLSNTIITLTSKPMSIKKYINIILIMMIYLVIYANPKYSSSVIP